MTYPPTRWPAPLLRLIARLWNDGVNTARPVTQITVPDVAAPDVDIVLSPKGTGAISADVPDGTAAGGNKRGTNAVDWQTSRTAATQVASGVSSVICGGYNNTSSGSGSFNGGGDNNSVSASNGFNGAGLNNSVGGASSFCGAGSYNSTANAYSTVCGGYSNTVTGDYGAIVGGAYGTTRGIVGYHAFPACNSPINNSNGVSQAGLLILGRQTTDATATALTSTTAGAGTSNQLTLSTSNSAISFSGEVVAAVTGGGDTARWTIAGAIKRGATLASVALVGTPTVTMTHNDAGAGAWVVAVTADTTNGALRVTVTGAAATTIRWVCRLDTTEVRF